MTDTFLIDRVSRLEDRLKLLERCCMARGQREPPPSSAAPEIDFVAQSDLAAQAFVEDMEDVPTTATLAHETVARS